MIVAVGTDLCEVERVELAVARTGERFLARVFTPAEQASAERSTHPAAELARFFAVKEATFKALGRGWPDDISFTEIEIAAQGSGPREIALSGRAAAWAEKSGIARLVVASCVDRVLAAAVVIAERA